MRTKTMIALCVAIVLIVEPNVTFATMPSGTATTATSGTPTACPISQPNDVYPPEMTNNDGNYGNEALWTNLTMWSSSPGIVEAPDDGRIDKNGVIHDMKWAWYRFASGQLTVVGHRLDAKADPLIAWIPDGYGDRGFQVTGITFPSTGCWEITGSVAGVDLTFVVLVVVRDVKDLSPDSEATPSA